MTDVMPEQQAVDLDGLVGDEPAGTDDLDAVALAVTVDGHRDILGLWAGDASAGGRARSTGCTCSPRSKPAA